LYQAGPDGPIIMGKPQPAISQTAHELHFRSLVIDTHVDTTQRLLDDDFDLGARHADGSIDIPRMREGGVGAIFLAIWIRGTVTGPEAVRRALEQIGAVRREAELYPHELTLATTADDIRRARAAGRIAILIGIEGGHMMNGDLETLREYAALGASYLTLTHTRNTDWADASTDRPLHGGLSEFGKQVIGEMNRLGMMVDVSHASDKAFYDALAASHAPIFASHSSCRVLCGAARNMSDDMIQALAAKDGLIQINFHMGFVSQEFRDAERAHPEIDRQIEEEITRLCGENAACRLLESDRIIRQFVGEGKLPVVGREEIIRHIDHAVKIAGIDHVGIGSDFDGAEMPYGMEDASRLPWITHALLEKRYSEDDIQKILGGNMLRFMESVATAARSMRGTTA